MKFTLDNAAAANAVTGRGPGEVRIGTRSFRASVLVNASAVVESWPVRELAALAAGLDAIIGLQPEIVILGTGERQLFPDPGVHAELARHGIGLEVMDNGAACRTYNVLLAEGRNVALALIL